MKMTYIIVIILIVGIIIYLTAFRNRSTSDDKTIVKQDSTNQKQTIENAFKDMRDMAFQVSPRDLGLSMQEDKTIIYGIIMDWGMPSATATIVSYQTGDASLYLSSGGGVIGGGKHENVSSAAKELVRLAQKFINDATITQTTPLPKEDSVKFYFLTNKGMYVGEEGIENLENRSSKWVELFEEGNKVLGEIRKTSENN
jgi:hypothetical protein